ncbi:MAG: carbohydrate ABC transporter permease, partial [Oscillospiraceae bacterium]|nr:carbohydrate ABC transporter permease [Oscillospiraceae bacterium]
MTKKKKKRFSLSKTWTNILLGIVTVFTAISAVIFLLPTVLTITNSFMAQSEINANYGMIFNTVTGNKTFIADKVNLKFIPDMVSFGQYGTFLLKSPDYLLKFWNSVIYTVPIVIFQILVALGASYSFA